PYDTPTPQPSYGYPQQGYQTPAPAYGHQQGPHTPPAYNLSPQQSTAVSPGGGGRKNSKAVLVGAAVVALVVVGGLIASLADGSDDDAKGGTTSSSSPAATKAADYRGPDTSKTIESTECSEPQESYNDPDKIRVPNFKFKYIASVKECFQAAGWQYKITKVDENTYGDGAVMDQFPSAGTDVNPEDMPEIEIKVSTGNPAS
ncbi:PASTA domain-containing protein, partial [Streptomyces sp. MBT97]|uniref:PASTA domain-containing protein n=1 Tax=Streptomyces sp. MBT97 TaxID=2800411 RepID=UPI00190DF0D5